MLCSKVRVETDRLTDGDDYITSRANAVGNKKL